VCSSDLAVADLIAGGVPAAPALAAATSTAAQACGLGHRKGRLRTGYDADLLLVQGNPLVGISALHRVTAVMLRGAMIDPAH
jgi:imidazolonepropionase-like amidohydrolase